MSPQSSATSPGAEPRVVEVAVAAGPRLPRRAGADVQGIYSYHLIGEQPVQVGSLVEVPFGSRLIGGIVVGFRTEPSEFPTRPVNRVIGDHPLLSPRQVEIAHYVARTYRAPLYDALCLVLPPGFKARLPRALADGAWSPPRFRRLPTWTEPPPVPDSTVLLNPAQAAARDEIVRAARAGSGERFLLYGVTGSGKTLVYLEAIAGLIASGQQAIVLVSEIGLTPALVARFEQRFPGRTTVLHSRLSPAEHYHNWQAIASGRAQVVLGSRSALFAPAPQLGLVVLDEEHEWTYKQESSPRYHARDVALEIGRLSRVPVVLSSATPDISTMHRARSGDLRLLQLSARFGSSAGPGEGRLPTVQVVDLREELLAGNLSIFSRALRHELAATLERSEQAILFINRRGTATCVTCRHCGHVVSCRRCEVPLVYHRAADALICHRCNRRRPSLEYCPGCGGTAIRHLGVGTQRVEQEINQAFPGARVLRWDRDTSQRRGEQQEIWDQFGSGLADVLVGTQLVAKALDFPLVTLVGVVLADVGLFLPDFRAAERSFQLLTQVAGRAGRGERPGKVVVQTYTPQHYAIQHAARHDFDGFYQQEIRFRHEQGYPPFGRLVRFVYSGTDEQRCWRETSRLRRLLQERLDRLADPEVRLIGPAPCYLQRLRGRYRWQIVARAEHLEPILEGLVLPPGWIMDVDPVTLL